MSAVQTSISLSLISFSLYVARFYPRKRKEINEREKEGTIMRRHRESSFKSGSDLNYGEIQSFLSRDDFSELRERRVDWRPFSMGNFVAPVR